MKKFNITIYSIFLPRIELFFIEEWLIYHKNLGVNKIYLYNNGFFSEDHSDMAKNSPKKVEKKYKNIKWDKKPDEDYNLHLTDTQILLKLEALEEKYEGFLEIKDWGINRANSNSAFKPMPRPWAIKKGDRKDQPLYRCYPGSQFNGARHLKETLEEIKKIFNESVPTHWLYIDIDEFIAMKSFKNLHDLVDHYADFDAVSFREVLFDRRKKTQEVKSIFNFGYEPTNIYKSVIKHSGLKRFLPHISETKGRQIKLERSEAEVFHYRGMPWTGSIMKDLDQEIKEKIHKYGQSEKVYPYIEKLFSKKNYFMKKYL